MVADGRFTSLLAIIFLVRLVKKAHFCAPSRKYSHILDVYQAVYRLKNVFPKSRLLFACHNCFNRTPPIIVELGK